MRYILFAFVVVFVVGFYLEKYHPELPDRYYEYSLNLTGPIVFLICLWIDRRCNCKTPLATVQEMIDGASTRADGFSSRFALRERLGLIGTSIPSMTASLGSKKKHVLLFCCVAVFASTLHP